MDLDTIYDRHPLSARTILARVQRQGREATRVPEWTLAVDAETQITDQNHSGGVQAVFELAEAARVSASSLVVDAGSGLGGPARVLAEAYGCRVLGLDANRQRFADSVELTAITGLSDRVTFRHHDARMAADDIADVDVLWGQGAWTHFEDADRFLAAWTGALRAGGRVAFSDTFLKRAAANREEQAAMGRLADYWSAHFASTEAWRAALEKRGCRTVHYVIRDDEAIASLATVMRVSTAWPPGTVSDDERNGWVTALDCFTRGLITAAEIVAVRA